MSGLDAANAVNRERQVPVILVTGHHDADFLKRAADGYIMACLSKPIKPADLGLTGSGTCPGPFVIASANCRTAFWSGGKGWLAGSCSPARASSPTPNCFAKAVCEASQ